MLILKLLLVPLFLAGVSIAARRWGPQVGGLLAGLPVVTGPILYFLHLEQGVPFAAVAAQGSLLAVIANIAFGVAYSHGSRRLGWPLTVVLGLTCWGAIAFAFSHVPESLLLAAGLALAAVVAGPFLLPSGAEPSQAAPPLPHVELAARMVVGAALVITVTAVAENVGTRWAGLLGMIPVLGTVLGIFSHRSNGPAYVARLFRGMFRGFYAFVAFCFTLSLLLGLLPANGAFAISVAVALIVQAVVHWATAQHNSSNPMTRSDGVQSTHSASGGRSS